MLDDDAPSTDEAGPDDDIIVPEPPVPSEPDPGPGRRQTYGLDRNDDIKF